MDEMQKLESCFVIKILIYCLNKNGPVSIIFNEIALFHML